VAVAVAVAVAAAAAASAVIFRASTVYFHGRLLLAIPQTF
jgi:hypothetical protein